MTDLAIRDELLGADEARALTEKVKTDAAQLWGNLLRLHDGDAHLALGYSSWSTYCEEEFQFGARKAYRLLDAARVLDAVKPVSHGTMNERQARELVPLLDQPDQLRDAWTEASSNGTPTTAKVREAVARVLPPVTPEAREKQRRWAATMNVLDGLAHFDRPANPQEADNEAALIDEEAAATRGQAVTSERLRNASAWAGLLADALERRST